MDLRAEGYSALSECYKEPTAEFAAAVASGALDRLLAAVFESLGVADRPGLVLPGSPDEIFARLTRDYHALFAVPSLDGFVLPVESVFKDWNEGSGLLGSSVRGLIMGAPATDMLRRYRSRGIEVPVSFKDWPDHLALLLEYAAILCEQGEIDERHDFLASHLNSWVDALRDEVWGKSSSPFYRAATAATAAFLRAERKSLR